MYIHNHNFAYTTVKMYKQPEYYMIMVILAWKLNYINYNVGNHTTYNL